MAQSTSTPQLFGDTIEQGLDFIRAEVRLFQAELHERYEQFTGGLMLLNFGSILLVAAVFVLVSSLLDGVVYLGMPRYEAELIVGLTVGGVGAVLVIFAWVNIRRVALQPIRAFVELRADKIISPDR
jgi:hypothetical protein